MRLTRTILAAVVAAALVFIVLAPAAVLAQAAAPAASPAVSSQAPATDVVANVETAIGGVLSAGVMWLLALVGKRLNISIGAANEATIRAVVQNAILFAEEYARKSALAGKVVSGDQKLQAAVEQIVEKLPNMTPAKAQDYVHQELPKVRGVLLDAGAQLVTAAATPAAAGAGA